MTTPVADKTPISPKIWRRHSDPPSLWIFVAFSSVSLHLLVFWLIRPASGFGLWFPQQSQTDIPIEFVEISPTAKSKLPATTVSPKPNISSQKPESKPVPETAKIPPRNQDSSTRILDKKEVVVSQKNTNPSVKTAVSQPKPTPTTTPQPNFTPPFTQSTPTPRPTPTIPVGNLPWNRRQRIVLGKASPLPTGFPSEQPTNSETETKNNSPTPTGSPSPGSTEKTSSTPIPTRNTSQTPINTTSPTPQTSTDKNPNSSEQAGSIVKIVPLAEQEMRLLSKDLPDVLAKYQGSSTKKLAANSLNGEIGLAPAQLLASFVIDQNGNFQQVVVLEITPPRLQGEKGMYQQAINELFINEKFTPAYNQDGSKPDFSNLFVRITIEAGNLN